MLPLDLLGVVLAWVMLFGTELTRVRAPMIGVITGDSKGLLQLDKHLILASAKHVRQHRACAMIDGVPQPPLLLLLPHKAPHFIDFGVLYATDHDFDSVGLQGVQEGLVHGCERRPFFFNSFRTVLVLICNTRAVSRTPLAFRLISITCCLISGKRPL